MFRVFSLIESYHEKGIRRTKVILRMAILSVFNHISRSRVCNPENGNPVVSLTTYSARIRTVFYVIESIASASIQPSRIVLWIDDENLMRNLPSSILRLVARGLEVKRCRYVGPHAKYFPYIEAQESFSAPLVTADDDMIYPTYWLERLRDAFRQAPDLIHCNRADVMVLREGKIGKYAEFPQCVGQKTRYRNIAQGVLGVIYPPRFLQHLQNAGAGFEGCCPKADDIWLHVQAIRAGYRIHQIVDSLPRYGFLTIPGTQTTALNFDNLNSGGNDRQVVATYTDSDISLLMGENDCA